MAIVACSISCNRMSLKLCGNSGGWRVWNKGADGLIPVNASFIGSCNASAQLYLPFNKIGIYSMAIIIMLSDFRARSA